MYRSYSQQCRLKLTSPPKGGGFGDGSSLGYTFSCKICIGSTRRRPAEWVYSPVGNRIYNWRRRRPLHQCVEWVYSPVGNRIYNWRRRRPLHQCVEWVYSPVGNRIHYWRRRRSLHQ
jgi:hypothetical protein